jgi:hypothetical protein
MNRWTRPIDSIDGHNTVPLSIRDYINNELPRVLTWDIFTITWYMGSVRRRCNICKKLIETGKFGLKIYPHGNWRVGKRPMYVHGVDCFSEFVSNTIIPETKKYQDTLFALAEDIQAQCGDLR